MDIIDLGYQFIIKQFNEIDNLTIKLKIKRRQFIIKNDTDAYIQCHYTRGDITMLLTEIPPFNGYANNGIAAIRHDLDRDSAVTFTVVGDAPTEGKMYITFAQ